MITIIMTTWRPITMTMFMSNTIGGDLTKMDMTRVTCLGGECHRIGSYCGGFISSSSIWSFKTSNRFNWTFWSISRHFQPFWLQIMRISLFAVGNPIEIQKLIQFPLKPNWNQKLWSKNVNLWLELWIFLWNLRHFISNPWQCMITFQNLCSHSKTREMLWHVRLISPSVYRKFVTFHGLSNENPSFFVWNSLFHRKTCQFP